MSMSPSVHSMSGSGAGPVNSPRRASRRRTGPLSVLQRERAAIIRKLGACNDCRRRRVACDPNHHAMTWEDAARKYRSNSPMLRDISPVEERAHNPTSLAPTPLISSYPQPPELTAITPSFDGRTRTPLPSAAPRLERSLAPSSIVNPSRLESELQSIASGVLCNPWRARYSFTHALLIIWKNDNDPGVQSAIEELSKEFEQSYLYTVSIKYIPPSPDGYKSSWRWLSREITEFVDCRDQRDVLKIVYYNGHSCLDENREMILMSSKNIMNASTIRWSGIQQILEEACADTLIIMDAAYYPSAKLVRQRGVLEVIAASTSEDHLDFLERSTFTRALIQQMRTRASRQFMSAFSTAELHAKISAQYPKLTKDRNPESAVITSFPAPLYMQVTGDNRLPSIVLSPLHHGEAVTTDSTEGCQLKLIFQVASKTPNLNSWSEWLRMMPADIKDVKVEGSTSPLR